jgi:hypothetical protein
MPPAPQDHHLRYVSGPQRQQHRHAEIERTENDGEAPSQPVGQPAVKQRSHHEADRTHAEHQTHVLRADLPVAQDGGRGYRDDAGVVAVCDHHQEAETYHENGQAADAHAFDGRIEIERL